VSSGADSGDTAENAGAAVGKKAKGVAGARAAAEAADDDGWDEADSESQVF
jgi:hypothetical protein